MTEEDPRAHSKTCRFCGFFGPPEPNRGGGSDGTCRRHPPSVFPYAAERSAEGGVTGALGASVGPFVTVFPQVGPDDWCGEYGEHSLSRE